MKLKYNISHYLFPLSLSFPVTSKMQIANAIFIAGRLKYTKNIWSTSMKSTGTVTILMQVSKTDQELGL